MPKICRNCSSRFMLVPKKPGMDGYKKYELTTQDGEVLCLMECYAEDSKNCNCFESWPGDKEKIEKPKEVFEKNECKCFDSVEDNMKRFRRHIPNHLGG